MKPSHSRSLQIFAHRLEWLFRLRTGVRMAALWFFIWGVVVLAARISGARHTEWLTLGVPGFIPLAIIAGWRERSRRPAFDRVRAGYDSWNACGGVIMAEETADMTAWQSHLPEPAVPKLRWHSGQAMLWLSVSAAFMAAALLLPERLTRFSIHRPLEVGPLVDQLQAEVQTLHQEKIVEDKKAEDLQQQLARIKEDSSGFDPNKTWEALDHIKEANSDAAKQAAEEALAKMSSLAQAETLAQAMSQAATGGMSEANATESAQDLASLLNAAKLEDGLMQIRIPPELLAGLNGLNREQLKQLRQALEWNKNSVGLAVSNLANLKLIDPALLAKCQIAGQCNNPDALAEYLSTCTNGCNALAECQRLGRGGPGGGGPAAPMTWDNNTSEKDVKFQEHAPTPSANLSDAHLVGLSKAAPELNTNAVVAAPGALDNAAGAGGSAQAQVILPEHRQAVRNFFKRDN